MTSQSSRLSEKEEPLKNSTFKLLFSSDRIWLSLRLRRSKQVYSRSLISHWIETRQKYYFHLLVDLRSPNMTANVALDSLYVSVSTWGAQRDLTGPIFHSDLKLCFYMIKNSLLLIKTRRASSHKLHLKLVLSKRFHVATICSSVSLKPLTSRSKCRRCSGSLFSLHSVFVCCTRGRTDRTTANSTV